MAEQQNESVPTCFVICPIGEEDSPVRRRADQVLKYIIEPVVERFGFAVQRADRLPRAGMITNQVIQAVADSELVIADLTDRNPNVFYELAIRHGLQKPLVQIIDVGQQLPFDVAGMRTIFFDVRDLDSVNAATAALGEAVRELIDDPRPVDKPVSVARDMKEVWASKNPDANILADLVSAMGELRGEVGRLRSATQPTLLTGSTDLYVGPGLVFGSSPSVFGASSGGTSGVITAASIAANQSVAQAKPQVSAEREPKKKVVRKKQPPAGGK